MKTPFSSFLKPRGPTSQSLRSLLQQIGAPTTGTKHVLRTRFSQELARASPSFDLAGPPKRILSIDMGFKNLAFCVADVMARPSPADPLRMHVSQWTRLDLTDPSLGAQIKRALGADALGDVADGEDADLFAPQALASTAYWLVRHRFLQCAPDVVLVERQRWRSSSSSAIQQWTVRVNSLEAMLWAALMTLRAESGGLSGGQRADAGKMFALYAAEAKRVGKFWLDAAPAVAVATKRGKKKGRGEDGLGHDVKDADAPSGATPRKLSRANAEKKAKIQLLRSWLSRDEPSTALSLPGNADDGEGMHPPVIKLEFSAPSDGTLSNARETQQQFLWATDPPAEKRQRKRVKGERKPKVDDLADCFLQAAAYVAWMENRSVLKEALRSLPLQERSMIEGG